MIRQCASLLSVSISSVEFQPAHVCYCAAFAWCVNRRTTPRTGQSDHCSIVGVYAATIASANGECMLHPCCSNICARNNCWIRRNVFNPFIRKGRVRTGDDLSEGEDAAPTKKGSLCHFDEDSGCASGDESDDSGKGALLDDETAASAALQASVARDSSPPPDWGCRISTAN